MGVEYSTSIAWGIEVENKSLSNYLPGWKDDRWTSTFEFCRDSYPLLEFIEAGDNWSGPERWVLVISSTLEDISEESGIFKFREPSDEERLQFSEAYVRLTGEAKEAERIAVGHIF